MSGRLAGGGDIYDGYCSQCESLEQRVRSLEKALDDARRAQFIGPIQEFSRPTFASTLARLYPEKSFVPMSEDEWRKQTLAAQERIKAGKAEPGDGVLAWANLVEDGKDWPSR